MKIKIIFFILICLSHSTGFAQKVGLVLSGGGAKGLAHIGVIKALEDNHIPISYITGTSMGAIIGGLYAAGYSAEEMIEIFKSEDFKNWSNGNIPSRYKYYYKKFDENSALYDLDFFRNIDNLKFLLPVKIISQGQMDLIFMQLFSPASANCENDFNKLFVPFRCLATDLYRNKQVVLKKGDLSSAIRASMSIPLYFKPIEIDSTLLFDGGLLNNFPVEVMYKEFHPDLIIGSTVEFTTKNLKNNLFNQIENMITMKTTYNVPDTLGYTIKSPVNQIGLFDFDRLDTIVKSGYESAMKMMDHLKSRIAGGTDVRNMEKEREAYRKKSPPLIFHKAEMTGVDPHLKQYVIHSLFQKEKLIPFEGLKNNYYCILAENRLKSIQPHAQYEKDSGYYKLNLKAEPQRPFSIAIGGYFSLSDVNEGFLGVNYRIYSAKPINLQSSIQFGRFYTSFLFGPRIEFMNERPFSVDLLFNKNMLNYFSGSSELFYGEKSSSIMRNENKMGIHFIFPYKVTSKWELGFYYSKQVDRYFQQNQFSKADIPDETTFKSGNIYLKFEQGELNKKQYSTDGKFLEFKTMFTQGKESETPESNSPLLLPYEKNHKFLTVHLNYEKYFQLFQNEKYNYFLKNFRIGLEIDSYFSTKEFFRNYTSTLISSNIFSPTVNSTIRFLPFLRSPDFAAGGLKFIFPVRVISKSSHLRLGGYYFQPVRQVLADGNNLPYYNSRYFTSNHFFGCGGLVVNTPFGPATLLLNLYDQGDPRFFLQASFGYLLTGRRE